MISTLRARPLPASREGLESDFEDRMGLFALLRWMVEEEEEDDDDLRRVGMMRTMMTAAQIGLVAWSRTWRRGVAIDGRR
jgi:hypothetical protein